MSDSSINSTDAGIYKTPYSCQIFWNATFTAPTTTYLKIATASSTNCVEDYDSSPNSDMFNQSSQRIDIKKDGLYWVHGFIYSSGAGNNIKRWVRTYIDGAANAFMGGQRAGGTDSDTGIYGLELLSLNSGQHVELYAHLGSVAVTVGSASAEISCRFSVNYLSDAL